MIPLRLTVKNFMCYRDDVPTLDLEGVHVACLCGDNGHGKTALLDAITWALWGQARARTQDELVHQGQKDMSVELEFEARGQRYRVSRRHSRSARSRQGATIMELQVASDNGARPITGNTVRETEARIREILHMDYDTFINTAFLRQGDADRFTTSRPAERKATLAEVLDLSYYQTLEERAKARSRAIQDQMRDIESAIALRRQEIARRPEHEAQLSSVTATLDRIAPEAEAQRVNLEKLRRAVDSLQAKRHQLDELARRLADSQRDVSHLETQVRNHQARVSDYESVLPREAEIRERFARLDESRAELERLDQALARNSKMDKERARLDREVAVQKERLTGQAAQLRKSIAQDLEPKANRLPEIEEGLRAMAQEQAKLGDIENTISQQREQAQEVAARTRDLELANKRLHQEMEETRKKFDLLEQDDSQCPLCKQPLGAEGQDHLRREYEALGLESKSQHQQNASEIKTLNRTHKDLTAGLTKQEAELSQGRQRTHSKITHLERDRTESQEAQEALQRVVTELDQAVGRLKSEAFGLDERRRLSELDAEISALGYDADGHQSTREQTRALAGYDELHRKLQEAVERLPIEREAFETARQMLDRRRQEIRDAEERKVTLEAELEGLPSLEKELADAQGRNKELEAQMQEARVQKGVLEKQLETYDALEQELKEQERERRGLAEEKSVYDELAVAFGKNGIQALIIETAIPQLEADANELLGRLTDNRMFLRLQLQEGRRDSRTGQPSEELDIKIADEVGTRSYETFSGGEAFRIDFALRIALSKLLARRSGAPLPILFIDEGFGSQDSAGQERLTQSIQSIQDDFQKIIVITHIDQIKEAFPVRIEVTKTGAGSTFQVV